ncbi:MAG: hypothetical protein ACFFFG_18050, partial [Candidatus Thorarchaeota archaeon]
REQFPRMKKQVTETRQKNEQESQTLRALAISWMILGISNFVFCSIGVVFLIQASRMSRSIRTERNILAAGGVK